MTEAAQLVITRIFDAPRAIVYRAFVDPDQLARWFGQVGWTVPRETVSIDARPGGHQRFVMVNEENPAQTSPANGTFVEVRENELLVGEEVVGDVTMRLRLEFHDEPDGRTRLVLTQGPFPSEIEPHVRAGWNSSFTKLDKVVAG